MIHPIIRNKMSSTVTEFRSTSDILAAVGQASYCWDIPNDRLAWSDNFFELIGFEEGVDVSSGREFEKLLSTDSPETRFGVILGRPLDDVPSAGIPYQCIYAINADQVRSEFSVWLEDTGRWYPDENGKPLRAEGVVRIINERRMREEKLERKSNYDDLTGLPNRRFLEEQINRISETGLVANSSAAFMMLSICDFDRVNNTYGFSAGDEVLKKIAENLGEMLRGEDILARFSGAKAGYHLKRLQQYRDLSGSAADFELDPGHPATYFKGACCDPCCHWRLFASPPCPPGYRRDFRVTGCASSCAG